PGRFEPTELAQDRKGWRATHSLRFWREVQRDPVDAIALVGRRRAVVEDMSQMAAAGRAMNLGAHHAVGPVDRRLDGAGHRFIEAWPARPTLEFTFRLEQRLAAASAGEPAEPLFLEQSAAPRRLGSVRPHHVILLRGQEAAPLGVAVRDLVRLVHCRQLRPIASSQPGLPGRAPSPVLRGASDMRLMCDRRGKKCSGGQGRWLPLTPLPVWLYIQTYIAHANAPSRRRRGTHFPGAPSAPSSACHQPMRSELPKRPDRSGRTATLSGEKPAFSCATKSSAFARMLSGVTLAPAASFFCASAMTSRAFAASALSFRHALAIAAGGHLQLLLLLPYAQDDPLEAGARAHFLLQQADNRLGRAQDFRDRHAVP